MPQLSLRHLALLLALLSGAAAVAQDADTASILRRPSEALGMPGLSIDLNTRPTSRYALVIGNGAYQNVPKLDNTIADARLVASVLRQSGYVVQEYEDLTRRGFEGAMRRLIADTGKGSEVLIYYAGHGVQVGNSNYVIPVDAKISSIYDLPFETVSLSSMLSIAGARSRSLVVILDSCRNNPFPDSGVIVGLEGIPQELRTGFAAQQSPVNSLIVFATSPDAVALDGRDGHSPFTEALAAAAASNPDAPIDDLLKEVRRRVYQSTDGLQVPWESSSLIETVNLDAEPAKPGFAYPIPATQAVAAVPKSDMAVSLPLDRRVDLGPALAQHAAGEMMITRSPQNGRLELEVGEQTRGLTLLTPVAGGAAGLIYAANQSEVSATGMDKPQMSDTFEVDTGGAVQRVQLTLNVDPCDFQAGDHLDPEGVGVARYPNEIEVAKALAACTDAVKREPDNGRFHYELGRVYVALRELDKAEQEFLAARDHGHTRAWNALGSLEIAKQAQTGGAKRTQASDKALAYLAMGVDSGDPYAFHTLGQRLLESGDTPELKRQGFDLLMRALEVGHTFSMNALGYYFLDEKSEHYDAERGLRYLRESAARGDIYGYNNLGLVALNGLGGTKPNPTEAFDWFRKASEGGHPYAPTSIGRMYFNGLVGGKPDFAKAVEWYDLGLSRGDAWGGVNAGWIIADRKIAGVGIGEAAARAAKAAAMSNAEATEAARELLDSLGPKGANAGAQVILNEMGEEVTADGDFGPSSQAALDRIAAAAGVTFPGDPSGRLVALAHLYWERNPFRVDLF